MTTDEMRRLHAASTPGEWARYNCIISAGSYDVCGMYGLDWHKNLDFVVAAHNSMPELLDRLDAAERALREIAAYDTVERSRDPRTLTAKAALEESDGK